jgi:N-acetylmuramoyl-L-alanine amidase
LQRIILSLLLLMILMIPQMGMAAVPSKASVRPELTTARWLVHKDAVEGTSKLRLVIDTTGWVKATGTLSDNGSPQLTIDIANGAVGKIDESVALDGDIADKVTFSKKSATTSQIVVDLSNMIDDSNYKVFTLAADPGSNKSFRIVIDITKPVPKANFNFTSGLKDKVIVIDPGHGGSDSGAIGPNKTQEKNITLAIGQKVKAMLENAGAKVLMTRQTDVDVYGPNASATNELQARVKVGNNNKADVFISLHIDAFSKPSVGGITTHYYQKTGYDALLAQNIQDQVGDTSGFSDRGTKASGFYVIKRTRMPAVLVEMGFVSNPTEEKLLNTPQSQQQLGQGIVQGLEAFFAQAAKKGGGS